MVITQQRSLETCPYITRLHCLSTCCCHRLAICCIDIVFRIQNNYYPRALFTESTEAPVRTNLKGSSSLMAEAEEYSLSEEEVYQRCSDAQEAEYSSDYHGWHDFVGFVNNSDNQRDSDVLRFDSDNQKDSDFLPFDSGTKWDHGAVPLSSTTNISVKSLRRRITECKVQAIVISENTKLDPSGGLAKAVFIAAGRSVWDDLKRQTEGRVQKPGTVLFTTGGALREITHIIHIVTPIWGNYKNRTGKMECLYILQSAIFACLKRCIDKSLTSFALAAIGTGNCGIPARLCAFVYASALLKIDEYSRLREITNLQIYLVDISEINLTSISEYYNRAFSSGYNNAVNQISNDVENDLGITSHNIREGFQVKAYKGDISVFREGSILCAVNKDLNPVGKDEENIANQAGAAYKQKLQVLRRARKYKGGQVAETIAGDLSTHLILHCIIPSKKKWPFGREDHYREKLIACYRSAFQLASEQGKTVVALSVLGVESMYMGMDVCCSALMDALRILLDEETSLKQLHIVCREGYVLTRIRTLLNDLKR